MSEQATIKYIQAPLTAETIKNLHAGDVVRISGYIYTARDAAHKRLYEALGRGEKLPLDLKEKMLLKKVLKAVKGPDVETLLKESGLI